MDPFLHYLRIPAVGLRVLNFPLLVLMLFTVWGETPSCSSAKLLPQTLIDFYQVSVPHKGAPAWLESVVSVLRVDPDSLPSSNPN